MGSEWEQKIDGEEDDSYKEDKSLDKNGDDHVKPEAAWTDLFILDGKYDRSDDYPDPVEGREGPMAFRLLRERWWTDVMAKALQENEVLWYLFTRKIQAELPELLDSHKILGIKGHGLRPKVDFDWYSQLFGLFSRSGRVTPQSRSWKARIRP